MLTEDVPRGEGSHPHEERPLRRKGGKFNSRKRKMESRKKKGSTLTLLTLPKKGPRSDCEAERPCASAACWCVCYA